MIGDVGELVRDFREMRFLQLTECFTNKIRLETMETFTLDLFLFPKKGNIGPHVFGLYCWDIRPTSLIAQIVVVLPYRGRGSCCKADQLANQRRVIATTAPPAQRSFVATRKSINIARKQQSFPLPQRTRLHLTCSQSQVCLAEQKPMTIFRSQKVCPLAPDCLLSSRRH